RFDGLEIETCTALHWREVEERLQVLADNLLNEDKAPELVLEPVEILLRAFFRTVVWPAGALKGIEPQIGNVGDVGPGLFADPTCRLVYEAELIIVDPNRTDRAFAEIENLVALGRSLAGDSVHLVVAIQMVLVDPTAHFLSLQQFVGDVRVTG